MYSKIFKIIIYVEDIDRDKLVEHCNSKFNKSFKIFEMFSIIQWPTNFLDLYGKWPHYLHDLTISKDNMLNYKRTNYYNKYDNPDFLNLVGEIEYLNDLPGFVENKYIAVHFRQKTCEYGVKWNNKYIDLDIIIQNIDYQIVVFSGNIENLIQKYNNNPKLYLTSNLQEYMSLLKNHNCLALISPWPGGGQIGSYCMNPNLKIITYFCPTQLFYNWSKDKLNEIINSPNSFDFVDFNNKNRFFINYPGSSIRHLRQFTKSIKLILNI